MFSQHGHLTLAHTDSSLRVMQERAEVNELLGIDSRVVYPKEIARMCPQLDLSDQPTWPIMGALYHAPGGIIRHDAVVWGFARGADRGGVEIHQGTKVTGDRDGRRPRDRRADEPRPHRGGRGRVGDGAAGRRSSAASPACGCRSRRTSSRRSSPSR